MTSSILQHFNIVKTFHVFDSFEGGLSQFTNIDLDNTKQLDISLEQFSEKFSSSYELLIQKLQVHKLTNVILNKGWIPDVFKDYPDDNYSFVHLDVDLYEPTYTALDYFFVRLNKGGVIVYDDYSYSVFPGAKQAVDHYLKSIPGQFVFHPFSVGGCMIIKS